MQDAGRVLCRLLLLVLANLGVCSCINYLLAAFDALEQDCPGWDDKSLANVKVPWGVPDRAYLTVPPGLSIQPSVIPGAGQGVISSSFIPMYTWLAEYEGEVVTDSSKISHYTWQVQRNADPDYLIDGHDVATSNWLRFLNCPRNRYEENVEVMECYGKIYYITTKDIVPGTELLVYYGDTYATELAIDIKEYGG